MVEGTVIIVGGVVVPVAGAGTTVVENVGVLPCEIRKNPSRGLGLVCFQKLGSLRRRPGSKWSACKSVRMTRVAARSRSSMSPMPFKVRKASSPATNASDRISMMNMTSAVATSISTSVKPPRLPNLVPKLCLGTQFRETLFPSSFLAADLPNGCMQPRNGVSNRTFPNRVWERGLGAVATSISTRVKPRRLFLSFMSTPTLVSGS